MFTNRVKARRLGMEIPHKQVEEFLREAPEQKIIPLWQNLRRGDVAEKTPDEIVTIADRSCESFLMDHLPKLIEGSLVLGEISEMLSAG